MTPWLQEELPTLPRLSSGRKTAHLVTGEPGGRGPSPESIGNQVHIKQCQGLLAIEKTDFKSILLCKIIHMNRKSENHYTFGPRYVGFFPSSFLQMTDGCSPVYDLVYLPQMCSINTEAMNRRLITSTGTGPTLSPGESSV